MTVTVTVTEREYTRDAVGQLLRVGDLVGGVRLGRHPVTVGGQVVKILERQLKVRVHLVTDTGDHDSRSVYVHRPRPGDEVLVYRERVFRVDALFVDEEDENEVCELPHQTVAEEEACDEAPRLTTTPWDAQTVRNLNQFQHQSGMHPFTCVDATHPVLVATANGWRCERCAYTQNWAHSFMADPSAWPRGLTADPGAWAHSFKPRSSPSDVGVDVDTDVEANADEPWCCNGNAEECVLCDPIDMPYPWLCPGDHVDSPVNQGRVFKAAAFTRDREVIKATMRRLRRHDAEKSSTRRRQLDE